MIATTVNKIAIQIVKEQEKIVGPLAWSEAKKVKELKITDHNVVVEGDAKSALEKLVNQYAGLFGRASIEVCRDAIKNLISDVDPKELPDVLQA